MSSSNSEKAFNIFAIVLYLFSLFLYFAGLVHSFKRHSTRDFVATVLLPPWAVCRGAEMFWHKDHDPNNRNAKLKDDAKTIFAFLNADINDPQTANSTKTEIEIFADRIATYPPDKIAYLKRAASQYIDFRLSLLKDFTDIPVTFQGNSLIGNNTRKIADSISKIYEYNEINLTIRAMNSLTLASLSEESFKDSSFVNKLNKRELLYYDEYKHRFEYLYEKIFSQPLILTKIEPAGYRQGY
jgi:hypothetical protein